MCQKSKKLPLVRWKLISRILLFLFIFSIFHYFRCERLISQMRYYGATNSITTFWYTTRRWEVIKFIILEWIRHFWTIRHAFRLVNWRWGQNVIVRASVIVLAPIIPLPKNLLNEHSLQHSLQHKLDPGLSGAKLRDGVAALRWNEFWKLLRTAPKNIC